MKRTMMFSAAAVLGLLALVTPRTARADDLGSLQGTIDSVDRRDGVITYLNVTLRSSSAQPANPELMLPKADPSITTNLAPSSTVVTVGMPVRLFIVRDGGTFTPLIGSVDSVTDSTHVVVRVDSSVLNQTWQDPRDDNNKHKVKEYIKEGASVTVGAVTTTKLPSNAVTSP